MPWKPKKTKGWKPWVNKSGPKDNPPETQAAVTASESGGASYSKIQKDTGVKSTTAYNIMQQAKKWASENQQPLLALDKFNVNQSKARRYKVFNDSQDAIFVDFITESHERRNM